MPASTGTGRNNRGNNCTLRTCQVIVERVPPRANHPSTNIIHTSPLSPISLSPCPTADKFSTVLDLSVKRASRQPAGHFDTRDRTTIPRVHSPCECACHTYVLRLRCLCVRAYTYHAGYIAAAGLRSPYTHVRR